jgi:DNA (cytosine-5)-methyltransferase 1
MAETIPVIDLFAGPGGLGEGFSRFRKGGLCPFKIGVSVEKDRHAHATLTLRSFFRQFPAGRVPPAYYGYLRGERSLDGLFKQYPEQAAAAVAHTLGRPHEMGVPEDDKRIDRAIRRTLKAAGKSPWVLIGGPPCQAYSLAGRSRRAREDRQEFENDRRHFLYEEYLRVIRKFKPTVFVMENVKGLLSATVNNCRVLGNILEDLSSADYELHSLSRGRSLAGLDIDPSSFLVRAEEYGVPQTRHRVFIVGIRRGVGVQPGLLKPRNDRVSVYKAIDDLPRIRSHISGRVPPAGVLASRKYADSLDQWREIIRHTDVDWFGPTSERRVQKCLDALGKKICKPGEYVCGYIEGPEDPKLRRWCRDAKIHGAVNHSGRSHRPDDLLRYFYVSTYGMIAKKSPRLQGFPPVLLPEHANAKRADTPHADRFKVQLLGKPSSTITCHISKDGHHYIHYDPTQCRSLTVREAARLQTFPDNYFFEGPRTEQYRQVGNAVPPFLANQIAKIIYGVFSEIDG